MPRNLDTDLLRAFIAVADTGGFTRAAGLLNCTQSAVSMQIKRLEGVIQAELVLRSNKGLSLTPAGERLIDYARSIVSLNDQIVETILDRRTNGVVRIGLMEDYASAVLPPFIKQFLRSHPNIHVEVHTGLSALMRSQLGKQFDLVLATQMPHGSSGEVLRSERPVWAKGSAMTIDHDLVPIALYPRDCVFRDLMLDSLRAAGRKWKVAYHSHSVNAVQAAVAEGIGLSVFKTSTLPSHLRPVSTRDGFGEMPLVDIVLHRAAGIKRSTPANRFADFLVSAMHSGSVRPQGSPAPRAPNGNMSPIAH